MLDPIYRLPCLTFFLFSHTCTHIRTRTCTHAQLLARKVNTLYNLAIQQLSKQDHYDFGLRALVSVLKYGGRKKRGNPEMPDEEVLLLAMKDMNVAKLTAEDLPLFNGVMTDLFPGVEIPLLDYGPVRH